MANANADNKQLDELLRVMDITYILWHYKSNKTLIERLIEKSTTKQKRLVV